MVVVLALGSLLLQVAPAGAVVRHGPPLSRAMVRGNTEMTVTDWSPGQGVTGFIANPNNPFDPVRDGYPASNPTTGFTSKNEGFAGVIHGKPPGGGATLNLYCIDINTDTWSGVGYALGTWDASNVMNVGYVARILNEYYPNTDDPVLANKNHTAAAVQAAIWFFSDRYVLNTSDPVYLATVAIVNRVRAEGPLVQPPPPSLTATPMTVSGTRKVLGPYTVKTDAPGGATVNATGANMFANRAGTMPIASGSEPASGSLLPRRAGTPIKPRHSMCSRPAGGRPAKASSGRAPARTTSGGYASTCCRSSATTRSRRSTSRSSSATASTRSSSASG